MVDVEKVLYEFLNQNGTELKTTISNRLFVDEVYSFENTNAGLMFRLRPGSNDFFIPLHERIIDFWCYGGTDNFSDSQTVYRKLHDALHGKKNFQTTSGFLVCAEEVNSSQNLVDPDTHWKVTLSTFQVSIRGNS